ncbi:MAG: hypothetical protein E5W70_28840, partial [Mesorhizobium sp.]|uniref:hypothetical protein n=1 Tax=Mesorhizobium sp. TaxID=1871066 RepID=UPI00120D7578
MTEAQTKTAPYKVGDRVEHGSLGHGTVVKIVAAGGQVCFDRFGQNVSFAHMENLSPSDEAKPSPIAANDNDLPFINPADWHGVPMPTREWFLDGLIPKRQVT